MDEILRSGPRFAILIGFDLNKPRLSFERFWGTHWSLVLGYLEIHLLCGAARDLQLDAFVAGAKVLIAEAAIANTNED